MQTLVAAYAGFFKKKILIFLGLIFGFRKINVIAVREDQESFDEDE